LSKVIEHDGSLSRNDIFFGDNYSFNKAIWGSVAAHFTNETISIPTAAAARKARLAAAAAANPEFSLNADGTQFSFIETALYLSVFGNINDGNAVTKHVRVLFGESNVAPSPLRDIVLMMIVCRGGAPALLRGLQEVGCGHYRRGYPGTREQGCRCQRVMDP
jgi:peroxidase family protein